MGRIVRLFMLISAMQFLSMHSIGAPINLHLCIVADNTHPATITQAAFGGLITDINRVFRQVGMSFTVGNNYEYNNSPYAVIDIENTTQWVTMFGSISTDDGLKIFFVPQINGGACAFTASGGIVIGPQYTTRTICHEIGHACGLCDIYDEAEDCDESVTGVIRKSWMPQDWGHYRTVTTHAELLQGLLMYGYDSAEGVDITFGDIHGLWYSDSEEGSDAEGIIWNLSLAPIGFYYWGNRHPRSL